MHQANEHLKDISVIECPRIISQETLSHAEMMMHKNGWFNENIEPVALETPKIEWFKGLSNIVRCEMCAHWKRDSGAYWNPDPCRGMCNVIDTNTGDDFHCKFFELNADVNVR